MKNVLWILIMALILYGCGAADEESAELSATGYTRLQNQIFFGTIPLELEITSGVAEPAFAWQATGSKYIVLIIFREKIDLKNGQISNPQDAVWNWNTGMGRGREGNVNYSDGRDVRNGITQDMVTPLAPGTYYIAAWGYNAEYDLLYSSKEYLYTFPAAPGE